MADSKKRSYNKGKNQYYSQGQKKKKIQSLEVGLQGFFCTCNFQEKNCVREAYNLLNEYADKLYGPEEHSDRAATEQEGVKVDSVEEEEQDISDVLAKQITDMKSGGNHHHRFQSVATSVQNVIFIRSNIEDPVKLGYSIIEDIADKKIQKTRFLLRLVPIEATCGVKLTDIINTAGKLFDKYFLAEPTTFSIVFNRRYNNTLSRDVVIKELAELIVSKNSSHKADLTSPKLSVIVEVIKGICLLSVVPEYFQKKKYNLVELCAKPTEKKGDSATEVVENSTEVSDVPADDTETKFQSKEPDEN